jgi:GH24 family phage-related lysozyme (muramidase)
VVCPCIGQPFPELLRRQGLIWRNRIQAAAETGGMTRIAPGSATPNTRSINDAVANASANASVATPASGPVVARERGAPTDAGADRPAPQSRANPRHTTIDVGALRDDLLRWEGNKPFMYLCSAGYVTTGIGNKLANAQEAIALPWQHTTTGLAATPAEIRTAFERVAAMTAEFRREDPKAPNPFGAKHYKNVSDLVLPEGAANQLAVDRLEKDFLKGLRGLFPSFDGYPQPAQRALVDMAYTLGVSGLETKFPSVVKACREGRFADAAKYSHRKVKANEGRKGDERNAATRNLLLEAARLNSSVQALAREVRP